MADEAKEALVTLFPGAPAALRRTVPRCQASSRRTKRQCAAAAAVGKRVCKWHGGRSTGPRTEAGRRRCALAKTVHGTETRAMRVEHGLFVKRLAELVRLGEILGLFVHAPPQSVNRT